MDRDFIEKLREVESIVNQGKKHLISHMWLVDRDALIDSLQELRGAVPAAIQDANSINASRSQILGDAKRFSDNMLAEATARARTLQQETETRVSQMITDAQNWADQARREAEDSAQRMLADAEDKAATLVTQTEVMRRAEVHAREINEEAVQRGNALYHEAMDKAQEILGGVEHTLAERINELRRFRTDIGQYR
ncbi:MAG: hypothetical protein FWD25_04235 [Clostridia bacterium]|nr:hypothetical protein [Clostridia bacterium]